MAVFAVTGATGMIACAFIKLAVSRGHEVIAFVHKGSAKAERLKGLNNVTVEGLDLADYATFEPKYSADAFFHFAWNKTSVGGRDDAACQAANIGYAVDAAALAKRMGCKCFIGAGSQAEYGRVSNGVKLNGATPCNPESAYGIAKLAAGRLTKLLCENNSMRHIWIRILSIYGKNDGENTLISYLIKTLSSGVSPELTPCGQIWDYLNADDAARAFLLIYQKGVSGKTYALGSGISGTLKSFAEEVRTIVAPNIEILYGKKDYYPHQPMYLVADISELTKDTGFLPEVAFFDGIKAIIKEKQETV